MIYQASDISRDMIYLGNGSWLLISSIRRDLSIDSSYQMGKCQFRIHRHTPSLVTGNFLMLNKRKHILSSYRKVAESKDTENVNELNDCPVVDVWLWENNQFVKESVFQNSDDKTERPRVLVALKSFEENADAFDRMHHAYTVMREEHGIASKRLADCRLGYYREVQHLRDELRKLRISISSDPLKNRISSFEKYVKQTEVYFFNISDSLDPSLKEAMQDAVRELCREYIAAGFAQLPLQDDEVDVCFPKTIPEIAAALKDLVIKEIIAPDNLLKIAGDAAINFGKEISMPLIRETAYAVADKAAAKEGMHRRISDNDGEMLTKRIAFGELKLAEAKMFQAELQRGLQNSQEENCRLKLVIEKLRDELAVSNAQISMMEMTVNDSMSRIYRPKLVESFSDLVEIEENRNMSPILSPLLYSRLSRGDDVGVPEKIPASPSSPSLKSPVVGNLEKPKGSPKARKNLILRRAKSDFVSISCLASNLEISNFTIENVAIAETNEFSTQTDGVSLTEDFFRISENEEIEIKIEKPLEAPVPNLTVFIRNIRRYVASARNFQQVPRLPSFTTRKLPNLPPELGAAMMAGNSGPPLKFLGSLAGFSVNKTWKLFLFNFG